MEEKEKEVKECFDEDAHDVEVDAKATWSLFDTETLNSESP